LDGQNKSVCNYSPELLKAEETGGSYITYIRKEACGLNGTGSVLDSMP
jgi:hypothetical protein